MKLNFWISLPLSLFCLLANANTTTTASTTTTTVATSAPAATSTTAAPKKEEASTAKFSFAYYVGYSLQAQPQPDGTRSQSLYHSFTPGISYGDYKASVFMSYDQDLIDPVSSNGSDPSFSLSKKAWALGEYFKLGPALSLGIPNTNSSLNDVSLMYSLGGSLSLSLNTKALGLDNWNFGYQLGATKVFTKYDTNAKSGNPNTSHKIRNRASFGYSFTDKLSFFNMLIFDSSYSVNGVVSNSFYSLQSVDYNLTDAVSVGFSHSNGGPYLKPSTYENNLKFFDGESSSYSVGLSINI